METLWLVNEYMANRFWPKQDPIGRRFRSEDLGNAWLEIDPALALREE